VGSSGTGGSRVVTNEIDTNVHFTDTVATGMVFSGTSTASPAASDTIQIQPLGTGIPWTTAINIKDAAATTGINLGATATSGMNVNSLPIQFAVFDGSSTKAFRKIFGTGTGIETNSPLGIGTSPDSSATFEVHGASDLNALFLTNSGNFYIAIANDANNALEPLEINASAIQIDPT